MISRNKKRSIAIFFIVLIMNQTLFPTISWALTSGPTQPEVQSFQPAGSSEMVDLFSGDFTYNIPLFELPGPNGGYPFNLSYQAGATMDQEASWVGLGWSLQPGAINRQMRGLPDEFKGDDIKTKMSVRPNVTLGLGAGVGFELFGKDKAGKKSKTGGGSISVGFSIYHNSYKGLGYSIDGSVGFEGANKSGMTGGIGLGLSLDKNEGATVAPSLSLGGKIGGFGLTAPYNSKSGLSSIGMSATMNYAKTVRFKWMGFDLKTKVGKSASLGSASISLASPGYTPQITMPMKNINLSATFKAGVAWWGFFGNAYVTGFYNEQWLKDDKKWVSAPAYGYLNYQFAQAPYVSNAMLDFNREKDGMVSKESPNLGVPSLTYDVYSVTGQGIGMMYRPFRNEHGIVYDQESESKTNGASAGVDIGPAATHVGVNLTVNHAESKSGRWSDDNNLTTPNKFQHKNVNDLYEPWYFKVHGEPVSENKSKLDDIGGEKAVRVKLGGTKKDPVANATLEYKSGSATFSAPNATANRERDARNQVVHSITNGELLAGSTEMISYYKVRYLDSAGTEKPFDRSDALKYPKHHVAGYTALNAEGLRYVYGIPAYNLQHEDLSFSVAAQSGQVNKVNANHDGNGDPDYTHTDTDNFLRRMELPRYAHSYLLTSIIGPDYVDVTNNGVTNDDLGYWVKFTYKKTTDDFRWRDPYTQAHYQEGWRTDARDDRGSFSYGKKELWYLAQAETKSHIAVFTVEERSDARGVAGKFQNSPATGKAVCLLKEIKLYSRDAFPTVPLKVTKFRYDYSLCAGVENNPMDTLGTGKLTLKKVWFEYGNSSRGSLNPYEFIYSTSNPGYDIHAYDRWGNYKPYTANQFRQNYDFPYSDQNPTNKAQIDANVSAWNIKKIILPSGGTVEVDYESDDYAYVQQKQAMQMTSIVDPYTSPLGTLNNKFSLSKSDYVVRFKLERPIEDPTNIFTAQQKKDSVLKYIDTQTWQLYFKLFINLRKVGEGFDEYICGYADIDKNGLMTLEKDNSNKYVYGSFKLKPEQGKHPFSMRAYQHIRTNQPELANSAKKLEPTSNARKRTDQIKGLVGLGAHIRQLFEGFYDYCSNNNWGREVTANASWIRLNSVDKVKYGGGCRVKQITMRDQWAGDDEGFYGQVYDYTTTEGNKKISSGVAAFEPGIGGDENALRFSKKYVQSVPLRSDNNLYFEYPVNESNYPGAQVGYSKVQVMSLASAALAKRPLLGGVVFPTGIGVSYGTTGATTHEFYTAKDFPVITDETEKENKPYKLSVPIPFLGNAAVSKLSASQGYCITTNDMHGKPKKVSNYRQTKDGKIETEPISWVRYNYMSEIRVVNKEKVNVLNNVLADNQDGTLGIPTPSTPSSAKVLLGQEHEFFYDMREYSDNTWTGGVRINADVLYFFFFTVPIPSVWPSVSYSKTQLRTAVTNKIIFKTGILQSVEAYDGGSLITTNNVKWDKLTGQPVLTTVNNNFDQLVYSYSRPAFREYQGMGAAFTNIGLTFSVKNVQADPYKANYYLFQHELTDGTLFPGDEILLYASSGPLENPVGKVVYTGEVEEDEIFYSEGSLPGSTAFQCMIVRSGFRNQLTVSAGTITALEDPSVAGAQVIYSKTISVPK